MQKLILFILFCSIFSVQSKVTIEGGRLLIRAGDPITLVCDQNPAKWELYGRGVRRVIADCTKCPSKCNVEEPYKTRITAFCNETHSKLRFTTTQIGDTGLIRCSGSSGYLYLRVGSYNKEYFYSESKSDFALEQRPYTLVCRGRQGYGYIDWFDEGGNRMVRFYEDCDELYYPDKSKNFTCDRQNKEVKYHMKQVNMNQDGKIFGCETGYNEYDLYLFNLTVNAHVESVSIQYEKKVPLLENKMETFVCQVKKSKPEASIEWSIINTDGLEEKKNNAKISKKRIGKYWQTNSTLELKLKRSYREIKCYASIKDQSPRKSDSQALDIKYTPEGKPKIIASQSGICKGETRTIKCEWKGGKPEAKVSLSCLSQVKTGTSSVSIKGVMHLNNRNCTCNGNHIAGNKSTTEKLNILYPPKVQTTQTSYLEGSSASLICNVSGGNPAYDKYSWSPGHFPPNKPIQLNLIKADINKTFTCTVDHKCGSVLSTIKLNVECGLWIKPTAGRIDIEEGNAIGQKILNITVGPANSGDILEISLSRQPDCPEIGLEPENEVVCSNHCHFSIVAKNVIDIDSKPWCHNIRAYIQYGFKGSRSSRKVYDVRVKDINDNAPVFTDLQYKARIPEDFPVNKILSILHIHATDQDSTHPNNAIVYTLKPTGKNSADINSTMVIDRDSGEITLMKDLDYEKRKSYQYLVIATDGGEPPKSATASVWIEITDVQDSPPVFIRPIFNAHIIEESKKGTSVVTFLAEDGDRGIPNKIAYSIKDACQCFKINKNNGVISVKKDLPGASVEDTFPVTVRATEVTKILPADFTEHNVTIFTYQRPWTGVQ